MPLKDKWIFILGATKFDEPFSSTSFSVAKHLALDNHVFYIDYPYTYNDCIRLRKTAAFKIRMKYFFSEKNFIRNTKIPGLKIVFSPPLSSINFVPEGKFYRTLLKRNEEKIAKRIQQTIKQFGIKDFIYINSFNFHYPGIANIIKPQLKVYHCVDPVIMPYDTKHGVISEEELLMGSDLVICTSKQLFEEKIKVNDNTFFIPNAAEIEQSSRALEDDLPIHKSFAHLKKPIIGYLGTIERRIDYRLMKEVIESNADKQFVFVGPVAAEFVPEWFFSTANLFLAGTVPYNETASVIKGFDVALIPFKKDGVSRTIFPLKLFEYLGAGKAVVATDFNTDLEEHTFGTVAFCKTAAQFTEAINNGLLVDQDALKKRLEVAQQNTWKQRVLEISNLLEENTRSLP